MAGVSYHDYLQIDHLLSCQKLKSDELGQRAHDEMFFIIVHQTYELWFKQILVELDSILEPFSSDSLDEKWMDLITARLHRIVEIQKLLVDQIRVLETMTPLDFLDFRHLLIPASGFQSHQFRLIETKLGLQRGQRIQYNQADFDHVLNKNQIKDIHGQEQRPSLFDLVDRWLARTPFLKIQGFDFWKTYESTVEQTIKNDLDLIHANTAMGEEERKRNTAIVEKSLASFRALFNETSYNELREQGVWRFSYPAIHAALLIQLYRDQPVLQLPFRVLTGLQDMDEWMTTWRYRHALMVKRMLGSKVGTGGSSGFQYLKDATEQHKVFKDLFQLTTFFVPRSIIPPLPKNVEKELGFFYSSEKS